VLVTSKCLTAITVIGATGYAIAQEAARRGHQVTGVSRTAPAGSQGGPVTWVTGSVLDPHVQERAFTGADVVVAALSPRGDMAGQVAGTYASLAALAEKQGVRLVVVGGFSALRTEPGGPRMADGDGVPPEFADEAREMGRVADALLAASGDLDWVYVSPAGVYGAHTDLADQGTYRVGGDVALFDAAGQSAVSGGDFATAVVDEIEQQAHRNSHIGIAY
jgi:hypothetical protein